MGFKDFMKKMADKQAESNRKMAKIREKHNADMDEIERKKNAMLDTLHPFRNPEKAEAKKQDKNYQKDRLKQLKKDHVPFCPKCKSTNITFVNKKLSLGRAVVGGAVGSLAGPLGTAAGATMGGLSSKKGKVKCLNCGHAWKIK
jgi:Zn finger protein HypA/HybF involved in hydrogenase expression